MSGRRGWTFVALVVSGLWLGCRNGEAEGPAGPSAGEREGRSDVLRGLMASKERAPEPKELKEPPEVAAQPVTPEPRPEPESSGQGGSGRPEAALSVQGQVSWVGDNELLIRDAKGQEYDFEVNPGTRLQRGSDSVSLATMENGAEVRVSYDEGPGGLVARSVEVLPRSGSPAAPGQDTRPRQGRAPQGGVANPPR